VAVCPADAGRAAVSPRRTILEKLNLYGKEKQYGFCKYFFSFLFSADMYTYLFLIPKQA